MLDLLIKNANVIDGSGAAAYTADVGIRDGRIVLPASGEAKEELDAAGLTLTPGFVDCHSHGDLVFSTYEGMIQKVSQGITSEVAGQCGVSLFPLRQDKADQMGGLWSPMLRRYPDVKPFYGAESLLNWAADKPLSCDMFFFVGHCNLRIAAMGFDNRKPTDAEMSVMKEMLKEAMEHGAVGLSSGLIYTPGAYADEWELTELCRVIAPYGGIYATHMRNESDRVVESVREAIAVAEGAGVPLVISHHKVCGKPFWGGSRDTLALIHEAIERGVRITMDQYPYTASMTSLNVCVPPWYFERGIDSLLEALSSAQTRRKIKDEMLNPLSRFDNHYQSCGGFEGIFIAQADKTPEAQGLFVSELAGRQGKEVFECFFDLLLENGGTPMGLYFSMCDDDVEAIYKDPNTVVGTDGLYLMKGQKGHPRSFGSFPRSLRIFWREKGIISLEKAIHKATGLTAERLGLKHKGLIANGMDADIVLLDPDKLADEATFAEPNELCVGIHKVYVAGQLVYSDGYMTDSRPGRIVRHNKQR